jgi:hypothetical protein
MAVTRRFKGGGMDSKGVRPLSLVMQPPDQGLPHIFSQRDSIETVWITDMAVNIVQKLYTKRMTSAYLHLVRLRTFLTS